MEYQFLNKFYTVAFSNGKITQTLKYQIVDTPISHAWLDTVRNHLHRRNCHVYKNQWRITYPTMEKIQALWTQMKRQVDLINSGIVMTLDHISMPEELDSDFHKVQKILNYLHLEFHRHTENKQQFIGERPSPLELLNRDIHILEYWISYYLNKKDIDLSCGFFLKCNDQDYVPIKPRIHSGLYQYWNQEFKFGDMLLGYHTVGKNILHCFLDNDQELVQQGYIRPQEFIGNEVLLTFYNSISPAARTIDAIKKWLLDNHLTEYINMDLGQHQMIYQPLLGRLTSNHTKDEINQVLELGPVSWVSLQE